VYRGREGEPPKPTTLASGDDDRPKILMVFTDDDLELKVMESPDGDKASFYSLRRKTASD
jgi:hypothetical protein